MAKFIAIYGSIAIFASIIAGIFAAFKRRNWSYWATWSLIFPPMLLVLFLMPKNSGPRPRRESLEGQEDRQLAHDERH
jgi:hypothetical protein